MISAPPDLPVEWNENEVSRSATIDAFQSQDVFALMLTMASNIGEDFNTQDVVFLEILFHMLKGVDVEKLFMDDVQLDKKNSRDLQGLIKKEAAMLRGYAKNAPTRHNRFGTMIWIKRDDEKVSTLSGQDVLTDGQHALSKMDQSKKWNKPRRGNKEQRTQNHFDIATPLNKTAKQHLRSFVEDFLDSGFNPLFGHLRRAIEREADRVLLIHTQQFLYLISWFLAAERARKAKRRKADKDRQLAASETEGDSYGLIASVLNQETFILLNRYMEDRLDHKSWHELNAGMRCFTQILLTVQEMSESKIEEDQEIAENIQNRIFYEEATHDRIIAVLRTYKDQGFNYLDACTELVHVFLRVLERYSKENIDLQIRSKRRARAKKKQQQAVVQPQEENPDMEQDSEAEDEIEAQRLSRERKFDFKRFAAKFVTQPCVDTFVALTTFYRDLTTEQLKRAHRFFYRVAFKQEMCVILLRLDIISLFHRMIKGPEGMNVASPMYAEWQELAKQVFRRLVKKMKERPELAVELLFSKTNAAAFYLEYGYDKSAYSSIPRAPAELEIKDLSGRRNQIGVVIAATFRSEFDTIMFIEEAVKSAASERESWEAAETAKAIETESQEKDATAPLENQQQNGTVLTEKPLPPPIGKLPPTFDLPVKPGSLTNPVLKPTNPSERMSLFKNAKLRLLLTLIGLTPPSDREDPDLPWTFPTNLTSTELKGIAREIEDHRCSPPSGYGEDGEIQPEDMFRRKLTSERDGGRGSGGGGGGGAAGYGEMFGFASDTELEELEAEREKLPLASGPAARKTDALEQLKKKRRKRRHSETVADIDDEENEKLSEEARRARRKARLLADLERRRKIKSTEFVHSSDEEEGDEEKDREFFAGEEKRRVGYARRVEEMMRRGGDETENIEDVKRKKRRRIATRDSGSSGEEDDLATDMGGAAPAPLSSSSPGLARLDLGTSSAEDGGGDDDTPMSSGTDADLELLSKARRKRLSRRGPFAEEDDDGAEDGGETADRDLETGRAHEHGTDAEAGDVPGIVRQNAARALERSQKGVMEVDRVGGLGEASGGDEDEDQEVRVSGFGRSQRGRMVVGDESDEE